MVVDDTPLVPSTLKRSGCMPMIAVAWSLGSSRMASSIRSYAVTAGRCPYRARLADRGTGLEPARSTDSAAASAIPPIGGRKYIADMFQVPELVLLPWIA
jgi:hypothetical protein